MTAEALRRLWRSLISPEVWVPLVVIVVLGVSFDLRLQMIDAFPLWYDEGYYLNLAANWMEHGELTFRMWRLPRETNIIAGGGCGYGLVILAEWLRVFGLSLASGRALMLVCSFLSLGAIFAAVRSWSGTTAAAAAVVYAAVSGSFMRLNYVRMDAPAVLAYSVVLWLFVVAQRRGRWWRHLLVGIVVVLAAEFHAMAFVYAFALSLLYAAGYLVTAVRERRFVVQRHGAWPFGAGAAVMSSIFLGLHVFPDVREYLLIKSQCSVCEPRGLQTEWMRGAVFAVNHRIDAIILAAALTALVWLTIRGRRSADVQALLLAAGVALGLIVFNPPPGTLYTYHLLPVFALVVGSAFAGLFDLRPSWRPLLVGVGLVIVALLVGHERHVTYAADRTWDLDEDCPQLVAIRENASPDTVVMATPPYFAHLTGYSEFLAEDGEGRKWAEALYGVPYFELLELFRPQVYLGELWPPPGTEGARDSRSPPTRRYMRRHGFREVMPRLWVTGELLQPDSGSPWNRFALGPHVFSNGFEAGALGEPWARER